MNSHHDITEQLRALRRVQPHAGFAARSRANLLALQRPRVSPWGAFRWAGALAFAVAFLFLATFALPPKPTLSASFNEGVLTGELENLPVNIELRELSYRAVTERAISSAIAEIGETEGAHLNSDILSSELSTLEPALQGGAEIDTLLDEVLQ